jgi:hypothetical protein
VPTRQSILAALAVLALTVAVWAAFGPGGGSARAAVGLATGPLAATDRPDAAVLTASGLRPGASIAGEITLRNDGDTAGDFTLGADRLTDAPSPAGPLSAVLELAVLDVTDPAAPRPVYAGKLGELGTVGLGTIAQGGARRLRFVVSFPCCRSAALDDPLQGASSTVVFVWTASAPDAPAVSAADPPARRAPARLSAVARQPASRRSVIASVTCDARCRATVRPFVTVDGVRTALPVQRRSLARAGRIRVRVAIPGAARSAALHGRRVSVGLRLRVAIGARTVTVARTVRLTAR